MKKKVRKKTKKRAIDDVYSRKIAFYILVAFSIIIVLVLWSYSIRINLSEISSAPPKEQAKWDELKTQVDNTLDQIHQSFQNFGSLLNSTNNTVNSNVKNNTTEEQIIPEEFSKAVKKEIKDTKSQELTPEQLQTLKEEIKKVYSEEQEGNSS